MPLQREPFWILMGLQRKSVTGNMLPYAMGLGMSATKDLLVIIIADGGI